MKLYVIVAMYQTGLCKCYAWGNNLPDAISKLEVKPMWIESSFVLLEQYVAKEN